MAIANGRIVALELDERASALENAKSVATLDADTQWMAGATRHERNT